MQLNEIDKILKTYDTQKPVWRRFVGYFFKFFRDKHDIALIRQFYEAKLKNNYGNANAILNDEDSEALFKILCLSSTKTNLASAAWCVISSLWEKLGCQSLASFETDHPKQSLQEYYSKMTAQRFDEINNFWHILYANRSFAIDLVFLFNERREVFDECLYVNKESHDPVMIWKAISSLEHEHINREDQSVLLEFPKYAEIVAESLIYFKNHTISFKENREIFIKCMRVMETDPAISSSYLAKDEAKKICEMILCLEQNNIDLNDRSILLEFPQYARPIANELVAFKNHHLSFKENRETFTKCFCEMIKNGTLGVIETINTIHMSGITDAIHLLSSAKLLNENNIKMIIENSNKNLRFLIMYVQLTMQSGGSRQDIFSNCMNLHHKIITLQPTDTFEPEKSALAAVSIVPLLYLSGIPSQNNFDSIFNTIQYVGILERIVIVLHCSRILNQENFDCIIQRLPIFHLENVQRAFNNIPNHLQITREQLAHLFELSDNPDQTVASQDIVNYINQIIMQPQPGQAQNNTTMNYNQSVHNAAVEKSAAKSILRLKERYKNILDDEQKQREVSQEIFAFVAALNPEDLVEASAKSMVEKLIDSRDFFKYIGNYDPANIGVTLNQTLLLTWLGFFDQEAHFPEIRARAEYEVSEQKVTQQENTKKEKMGEAYIVLTADERKAAVDHFLKSIKPDDSLMQAEIIAQMDTIAKKRLIAGLDEAARNYNFDDNDVPLEGPSHAVCVGGTANKLIEMLNTMHQDVIIEYKNATSAYIKLKALLMTVVNHYLSSLSGEALKMAITDLKEKDFNEIDAINQKFEAEIAEPYRVEFEEFPDVLAQWQDIDLTNLIKQYEDKAALEVNETKTEDAKAAPVEQQPANPSRPSSPLLTHGVGLHAEEPTAPLNTETPASPRSQRRREAADAAERRLTQQKGG